MMWTAYSDLGAGMLQCRQELREAHMEGSRQHYMQHIDISRRVAATMSAEQYVLVTMTVLLLCCR